MYSDIGAKIKILAFFAFLAETGAAIIYGMILIANEDYLAGLLCVVCGSLVAYVSSWLLYAFGQITEDLHAIKNKYYPTAEEKVKEKVKQMEEMKGQLSKADMEVAASGYLNRRVSLSDIDCTLIYVIPKSTGMPKEMHLNMAVGDQEFSSLDLFFSKSRGAYFYNGRRLALDGTCRPEEDIFSFDVSAFKSFRTEVDDED